ncbi:hypothetical protein ACHWQZ_G001189 [Mnemiopsis leidyi]
MAGLSQSPPLSPCFTGGRPTLTQPCLCAGRGALARWRGLSSFTLRAAGTNTGRDSVPLHALLAFHLSFSLCPHITRSPPSILYRCAVYSLWFGATVRTATLVVAASSIFLLYYPPSLKGPVFLLFMDYTLLYLPWRVETVLHLTRKVVVDSHCNPFRGTEATLHLTLSASADNHYNPPRSTANSLFLFPENARRTLTPAKRSHPCWPQSIVFVTVQGRPQCNMTETEQDLLTRISSSPVSVNTLLIAHFSQTTTDHHPPLRMSSPKNGGDGGRDPRKRKISEEEKDAMEVDDEEKQARKRRASENVNEKNEEELMKGETEEVVDEREEEGLMEDGEKGERKKSRRKRRKMAELTPEAQAARRARLREKEKRQKERRRAQRVQSSLTTPDSSLVVDKGAVDGAKPPTVKNLGGKLKSKPSKEPAESVKKAGSASKPHESKDSSRTDTAEKPSGSGLCQKPGQAAPKPHAGKTASRKGRPVDPQCQNPIRILIKKKEGVTDKKALAEVQQALIKARLNAPVNEGESARPIVIREVKLMDGEVVVTVWDRPSRVFAERSLRRMNGFRTRVDGGVARFYAVVPPTWPNFQDPGDLTGLIERGNPGLPAGAITFVSWTNGGQEGRRVFVDVSQGGLDFLREREYLLLALFGTLHFKQASL